jgi:hypothetical protein
MNPKVRLFNALPEFPKRWITSCYIQFRKINEAFYARLYEILDQGDDETLKAVYLTGFPRSGTTVMKYYFSQYPGLQMQKFDPAGFQITWAVVRRTSPDAPVLVDKSNHYVQDPRKIFQGCGKRVAICCMVRDPRDSLLSLQSFPESREAPRNADFWIYWYRTYRNFLDFAAQSPFGENIFFLRMEDFAASPVEAKIAYLTWLGLDPKIEPIDDKYKLPETREFVTDKVHSWSSISTEPVERWRTKDLTAETEKLLSGWRDHPQVAALMSELGYRPDSLGPLGLQSGNFNIFRPTV